MLLINAKIIEINCIAETAIRERTGCSVVAIRTERGMEVVPNPAAHLPADADIVLIGTAEGEERFLDLYCKGAAVHGR